MLRPVAEILLQQPAPRVLGFELRPFSLWHTFVLDLAKNPVVSRTQWVDAEFHEIYYACWVISRGYAELQGDGMVPVRAGVRYHTARSLFYTKPRRWLEQINRLASWLAVCNARPPRYDAERGEGDAATIPRLLDLQSVLTTRLGMSQEASWDSTPAFAAMQRDIVGEQLGSPSRWMSEGEIRDAVAAGHDVPELAAALMD